MGSKYMVLKLKLPATFEITFSHSAAMLALIYFDSIGRKFWVVWWRFVHTMYYMHAKSSKILQLNISNESISDFPTKITNFLRIRTLCSKKFNSKNGM